MTGLRGFGLVPKGSEHPIRTIEDTLKLASEEHKSPRRATSGLGQKGY
jgi:hypothetical protein